HQVLDATEQELSHAAALADRTGLFACPHTGVALAALLKLVRQGAIQPHERVVVISTANGLKFPEFKIGYHEDRLPEVHAELKNPVVRVPASLDAVRDAIRGHLKKYAS